MRYTRYTKETLTDVVENSFSLNEVLTKLKMNRGGGNYTRMRKMINEWEINTSHFVNRKDIIKKANIVRKKDTKDILIKNSTYNNGNTLKKRLYDEGLKQPICEECGQNEKWRGKIMSLIIDHIDGDHYNNEISNLRILCPNCNATMDTFAGKNRKIHNKLKTQIKKEKKENKRNNKPKLNEERKSIILNSGINFAKRGWGVELNKKLNLSPYYVMNFVKEKIPELYINCYKHS